VKVVIAINEPGFAQIISHFVINHEWPKNAEFTVLSVLEPMKLGNVMAVLPGPILDDIMAAQKKTASELCQSTVQAIKTGLHTDAVKEEIIEGFPKDEIVSYATASGADLIVIGSHDRKGLERLMLGSVSLAVVCHAHCTVTVVRASSEAN
jgi:nucleotide-binding universal stress UspA family protein